MVVNICGYEVLIDDEDYDKVINHKWHLDKRHLPNQVYILETDNKNKSTLRLHRHIMGCIYKDGKVIDHINGNTLDNRKCNLRICTQMGNAKNRKRPCTNKSGYKGVSWDKRMNMWRSKIVAMKMEYFLGYYKTKEEAYEAYCEASKKYHGEFGKIE